MNFKYYDIMSSLVSGVIISVSLNLVFDLGYTYDAVPLIAVAYVIGYFINGLSSLLEKTYYKTMGGMPSDILLTQIEGQNYTGFKRVKFYEASEAIEMLKTELMIVMHQKEKCLDVQCHIPIMMRKHEFLISMLNMLSLELFSLHLYYYLFCG